MNLTDVERHVLETYHAGQGKCTIADVARECDLSEDKAAEASKKLAELGLLEGERMRRITENGIAIMEGREVPLTAPATPVTQSPGTSVEVVEQKNITQVLGEKLFCKPGELFDIVARSVISIGRNDSPATKAEVYHVLNVMNSFDLNPWMKQVHAFRHKGKLQVMLGYDGWVDKAIKYPGYLGPQYRYSEDMVDTPDGLGRKCWEWVECTLHSKGRIPTVVTAFLDEWYVPQSPRANEGGPWQKYTRNRIRQKAFCLAVREHCGISLWDESDREQMEYSDIGTAEVVGEKTAEAQMLLADQLEQNQSEKMALSDPEKLGSVDPDKLILQGGE